MNETYLIDRCISMARECERLHIEKDTLAEELDAAQERIAILESVELLQELKEIDGTRKE